MRAQIIKFPVTCNCSLCVQVKKEINAIFSLKKPVGEERS